MIRLIGLTGKIGAGKSTAALFLQNYGFIEKSFADPLKRAVKVAFDLTDQQMVSDKLKEEIVPYWGLTPRDMFQRFGTESMRHVFGEDFWVRRLFANFDDSRKIVISDVRFENEAKAIRDRGGVIVHIKGPTRRDSATADHVSEQGIEFHSGDVVIHNNALLSHMAQQLDNLVSTK